MVLVVLRLLPESAVLGTVVPGMTIQMILASQVSVLQMTGPGVMAQAILACQSHIWLSW